MTCEHDWTADPLMGNDTFARYKCALCGCWGWRSFSKGDGRLKPVRPYTPPVYEPRKEWHSLAIDKFVEDRAEVAQTRARDVAADAFSEEAFERMLREEAER